MTNLAHNILSTVPPSVLALGSFAAAMAYGVAKLLALMPAS